MLKILITLSLLLSGLVAAQENKYEPVANKAEYYACLKREKKRDEENQAEASRLLQEERERHQQEEQKSAILLKAALFYICKEKTELNNRKKGR